MELRYFPCDERCKKPVGGIKINEEFTVCAELDGSAQAAFFVLTKENESPVWYEMRRTDGGFSLSLRVTSAGLYFYRFVVRNDGYDTAYYADRDLCAAAGRGEEWQLTVYEENYAAPKFLDGGVIYQIFPDRFNIGGERLKTKKNAVYRDDRDGTPYYKADENGIVPNNDFFGGNLDGVTEKLDYLKSLGVKCIYLNPIFEAASNHKYDTGSYRRIDGDFGGEEAFYRLLKSATEKGIKIVLDGVFSHTGDDSVYFNRYGRYDSVGAFQSVGSPYRSWYRFDEKGGYECWWDVKILPCTEETDPGFDEFINGEDGVVRTYMRMGIAGWRLDVADELPDAFLDNLTRAVKSVDPDGLVLGEVWEDASNKVAYSRRRRYLLGKQLDSVTNYPFKDAIIRFARLGDGENLARTVNGIVNNYPGRVLRNLMNPLSTHDTVRALTAVSGEELPGTKDERAEFRLRDPETAKKRLRLAVALQYTLPGVPCVYYGDEAGMEGCEDPFNRRFYPWENADRSLTEYFKRLGKLRTRAELNGGGIAFLRAGDGLVEFTRGEKLRIIANATDRSVPLERKVKDLVSGRETHEAPPLSAVVWKENE